MRNGQMKYSARISLMEVRKEIIMSVHIIHHNDDDGKCSAAVIYNELCMEYPMSEDNFIEYSHGGPRPEIDNEKLTDGSIVYIVDLALDEVIYGLIKSIRDCNRNVKIVHIDHHKTTFDFLEGLDDDQRRVMDSVYRFYRLGVSASMLCWVYSCMTDEYRNDIDKLQKDDEFDFTAEFSHVGFNIGKTDQREIRVPMIIRFVNDHDVWRHEISGTREFHDGFSLVTNKHPMSNLWTTLLYSSREYTLYDDYVKKGMTIRDYNKIQYEHQLKHAFESYICGVRVLCLNSTCATSEVFGDKINEYDAVCIFYYQGDKMLWKYSMYSKEDGIDVSRICKRYGGGGHEHAAGFTNIHLIFPRLV